MNRTKAMSEFSALYYPLDLSHIDEVCLKRAILIFDKIYFADDNWHSGEGELADKYALLREESCVASVKPQLEIDEKRMILQGTYSDVCAAEFKAIVRNESDMQKSKFLLTANSASEIRSFENDVDFYVNAEEPELAYSVLLNRSLTYADKLHLIPFTDCVVSHNLLLNKYQRAFETKNPDLSQIIQEETPSEFYKKNLLSINIMDLVLPDAALKKVSFKDILKFKHANREKHDRFKDYVTELIYTIESEPSNPSFQKEISKIVKTEISRKIREYETSIWELWRKMFDSLLIKTSATVTPTLISTIFAGLSHAQILGFSMSALAGGVGLATPEIIKFRSANMKAERNCLSYLMEAKKLIK